MPTKESALGHLWFNSNSTDRILCGWYLALGVCLSASPRPLSGGHHFLALHLVIIVCIAILATLADRSKWLRFAHDWYPLFIFIAAFEEIAQLSLIFVTHWQDRYILRVETAVFSVAPTIWLNRWHGAFMTEPLEFGYFTFYWIVPLVGGVLYAGIWNARTPAEFKAPRQPFRLWMDATVCGYIFCYLVYLLFPTEGPAHTLPPQPWRALPAGPFHWLVLLIQRHGGVHGNAFPSGHIMASVTALLATARWRPKLARWLVIPVLLMCAGAVYDGYHYASDIVAGALVGTASFYAVNALRRTIPGEVGVN